MKKHLSTTNFIPRFFTLTAFFFTFVILLTGCSFLDNYYLNAGQKALAAEKFAEASAAFDKAGSAQDAMMLKQYADAWLLLENGDFDAAADTFRFLDRYKDSAMMVSYCQARKQEALAQSAFSAGDAAAAANACAEAVNSYTALSLFRDSDDRASACRDLLYTKASDWMNAGRYEDAASCFAALGSYRDSAGLQQYCRASQLLQQGSGLEAADVFSEIPDILDSAAQAEAARSQAWQTAVSLRDRGDYEAAAEIFQQLGSWQNAQAERDSALQLLVRSLIASGSYHEALEALNRISDAASLFPAADSADAENLDIYLKTFVGVWLNAHAGVMNGFFSRSLLQSYYEPGGELDSLLQAELPDDAPHENYGFTFNNDGEVQELLKLDEGFLSAKVHGTASSYGTNASGNAMNANLLVLLDTRGYFPIVSAVLPL